MYRFHVGKVGVNVKGLPGYHLVLKTLVNSGISDEETLTPVLGELSVAVNIHMKNMTQLEWEDVNLEVCKLEFKSFYYFLSTLFRKKQSFIIYSHHLSIIYFCHFKVCPLICIFWLPLCFFQIFLKVNLDDKIMEFHIMSVTLIILSYLSYLLNL